VEIDGLGDPKVIETLKRLQTARKAGSEKPKSATTQASSRN
jgi:hypothetical protein